MVGRAFFLESRAESGLLAATIVNAAPISEEQIEKL
jgi:hypothetical protein